MIEADTSVQVATANNGALPVLGAYGRLYPEKRNNAILLTSNPGFLPQRYIAMLLAPVLNDSDQPADMHLATVAETLAAQGWCVVPDFMPADVWKPLAEEARRMYAAGGFRLARVGRGEGAKIRPEIRTDRVHWIDPLDPSVLQQASLDRIEEMRLSINNSLMLGLFAYEGHFALYPKGCFYRRHLDRFADARHRTVSCIQYLNEDWKNEDGGELRLYLPDGKGGESYTDIRPQGGTAVFFMSGDFEHMVMPSSRERLSLTGWFCQRR